MKELAIWATAITAVALLVLAGIPFEALGGTLAFVMFVAWVAIEFWSITRWLAKISARLAGEPAPDSVDRVMGMMDRQEREYAGTRNATQERRRRNG